MGQTDVMLDRTKTTDRSRRRARRVDRGSWSPAGPGTATFAALFMEGEVRSPDNEVDRTAVLLYAFMNRGLRLATDLPRLALGLRSPRTAERGNLVAETIAYPCQQQEQQEPRPAVDRTAGEYHRRFATLTRAVTRSATAETRNRRLHPRLVRSSA
jgi:hypothetical protein